jgi:hypothetical protein
LEDDAAMSFLRKMFSGRVQTDDPRRFVVEAMLGAMEADGEVTDEEMEAFQNNLEDQQPPVPTRTTRSSATGPTTALTRPTRRPSPRA